MPLKDKTKKSASVMARQKQLQADGKCIRCQKPRNRLKWYCDSCGDKHNESERRRVRQAKRRNLQ